MVNQLRKHGAARSSRIVAAYAAAKLHFTQFSPDSSVRLK
jgi:hypothetical protein